MPPPPSATNSTAPLCRRQRYFFIVCKQFIDCIIIFPRPIYSACSPVTYISSSTSHLIVCVVIYNRIWKFCRTTADERGSRLVKFAKLVTSGPGISSATSTMNMLSRSSRSSISNRWRSSSGIDDNAGYSISFASSKTWAVNRQSVYMRMLLLESTPSSCY